MADPTLSSELPNCPFRTTVELQNACRRCDASIDVPYMLAVPWAMSRGSRISALVAIGAGAWLWAPVLVLVYSLVSRSWWSLLGVPVAVLFYNLGYPARRSSPNVLSAAPLLAALVTVPVAFINGQGDLAVVAVAGIVAWVSNSRAHHLAVGALQRAALEDSTLLSQLWLRNGVRVRTRDGSTYTLGTWRDPIGHIRTHPRA